MTSHIQKRLSSIVYNSPGCLSDGIPGTSVLPKKSADANLPGMHRAKAKPGEFILEILGQVHQIRVLITNVNREASDESVP